MRLASPGALLAAALVAWSGVGVSAAHAKPSHGLSAFGTLKYAADFTHFAYANPDAPKGGRISMIGPAGRITFDSFNNFIIRGDAAQGLGFLYDALMTRAWDEPDSAYGLIARSAEVSEDGLSAAFFLRPQARFSDGKPVRAADVVFSFETLKKEGHPRLRLGLRDVVRAEAIDALTVRYTFTGEQTRDLPITVALLPVLPKHFYGPGEFAKSSLRVPVGSGPYAIAKFEQNAFVTYKRRADYWGKDLAVTAGRFNFDELRYEYYSERTAELEALKKGDYDLREEFTSRDWATAYNIPQVRSGQMVREELPDLMPSGTQGFFLNLRRKKFQDIRVRQAFLEAFDFEWTRRKLFFGAYERTVSYFENSDMKADGAPSPAEIALLEPYRDKLPASVFGEAPTPPVSNGLGADRAMLKRARQHLVDAGYTFQGRRAIGPDGAPLAVEFLIFSPSFERIISFYKQNLNRIGIGVVIQRVDPAQFEERAKSFDFDIITHRYSHRLTPGPELLNFWGAEAASSKGSFNAAGIADPVVDALINKVLEATNRDQLVAATRALDRVLRAGHYWVPQWYNKSHRMAYWNKFSRPEIKPKYNRGIVDLWWYDATKAAALAAARGQ